jgi:hypothetical protein
MILVYDHHIKNSSDFDKELRSHMILPNIPHKDIYSADCPV